MLVVVASSIIKRTTVLSFDHPTDTLVLGQKLVAGQNLTSQGGLYSFSLTSEGLFAYINSNPPQCYLSSSNPVNVSFSYVQFHNQSLDLFTISHGPLHVDLPVTSQYMRLEPDGHMRVYDSYWGEAVKWMIFSRILGTVVTLRLVAIMVFAQTTSAVVLEP
jgi:hypothetical protein